VAKPIGFSAFLKLLELSDGPRKTELKRKLGGGGRIPVLASGPAYCAKSYSAGSGH
jgi:hypothetical protein